MAEDKSKLEELRKKVKNPIHKKLLEAYEKGATSEAMITSLIELIKEKCDEISKS